MINNIVLSGRICADPIIRESKEGVKTAEYRLAVQRRKNRDEADFFRCIVFHQGAEFAEKFIRKGMRVNVMGRVQTGSYINKDGVRIPTFDVVVSEHDFCEPKRQDAAERQKSEQDAPPAPKAGDEEFIDIPDDIDDQIPFK